MAAASTAVNKARAQLKKESAEPTQKFDDSTSLQAMADYSNSVAEAAAVVNDDEQTEENLV